MSVGKSPRTGEVGRAQPGQPTFPLRHLHSWPSSPFWEWVYDAEGRGTRGCTLEKVLRPLLNQPWSPALPAFVEGRLIGGLHRLWRASGFEPLLHLVQFMEHLRVPRWHREVKEQGAPGLQRQFRTRPAAPHLPAGCKGGKLYLRSLSFLL